MLACRYNNIYVKVYCHVQLYMDRMWKFGRMFDISHSVDDASIFPLKKLVKSASKTSEQAFGHILI